MKVTHKYGTKAALEAQAQQPGVVYFITDTGEIYFDTPNGERVQMANETNQFECIDEEKILSLFQ